mgnify:CR=1 FL=1
MDRSTPNDERNELDGIDLPSNAYESGVDATGATHYHSALAHRVWVVADGEITATFDVHDIDDYVGPVVGRDSVGSSKPDPEGLLVVADEMGVDPADAVFVGDSESDRTAARRADMHFAWASEFDQRRYRA